MLGSFRASTFAPCIAKLRPFDWSLAQGMYWRCLKTLESFTMKLCFPWFSTSLPSVKPNILQRTARWNAEKLEDRALMAAMALSTGSESDVAILDAVSVKSAAIVANFTSNGAAIAAAIAKVPTTAGPISSVSVVDFGSTVYTGPLDITKTINRVRAGGSSISSNDGGVYGNSNGKLPRTGTWYEFVVHPKTGTNRSFSSIASPGPMRLLLNSNGTTYFTGDHYSSFKLVSQPITATPTIGSFAASPASVVSGTSTQLIASNATVTGGTIANVRFYRETNSVAGYQSGADTLVGSGSKNGNTYSFGLATTGMAAGNYTYYAIATDSVGKTSATSTAALTVTAPTPTAPSIGSFTITPNPVLVGGSITLTASNVTKPDGSINLVRFYRESNSTGGLQIGADTLVGSGVKNGTTFTLTTSTTGLAVGNYTYYAVPIDATSVRSSVAMTTLAITTQSATGVLLGWSTTGQTNFGTQGLIAAQLGSGIVNTTGLTRGSGVLTTGTATANAWGGSNWATTSAAGLSGNKFVTFGLTVSAGQSASLSAIDLNYRHSASGPVSGYWQYSVNSGAYKLIGDFANQFSSSSSSGASITEINLSSIAELQNLAAGTNVTIRLVPYGSTSSGGTWYVYDLAGNDVIVKGSVAAASAPAAAQNIPVSTNALDAIFAQLAIDESQKRKAVVG